MCPDFQILYILYMYCTYTRVKHLLHVIVSFLSNCLVIVIAGFRKPLD